MKNNDKKPNQNRDSNSNKKSTFNPKLKTEEKGNLKSNRFEKAKSKPNPHFDKKVETSKPKSEKPKSEKPTIKTDSKPRTERTDRTERPERDRPERTERPNNTERPSRTERTERTENTEKDFQKDRSFEDRKSKDRNFKKMDKKFERPERVAAKNTNSERTSTNSQPSSNAADDTWRLNRYISNSGVCSRREADTLIAKGEISVNGKVVKELGFKVRPTDEVKYKGKVLRKEKPVYVLLNKPKDFITTTSDPQGRKTVMDLVAKATTERIYPVGRLDRNTTGLLLFTNDGEMAKQLSHPSYEVQKIYRVELDKPFSDEDLEKLKTGLELEDGLSKVDNAAILSPDGFSVGVEIHIGKNRIVRRMFAHLGYEVVRLDRTVYAGLTKETLGRGQWRLLNEREIIRLRFFNKRGQ
jgi:23S rRNA pseudouridine2605 synthase